MTPEVNSNRFEISNHFEISFGLHGNLHRDFTGHLSKQKQDPISHVQMICFN